MHAHGRRHRSAAEYLRRRDHYYANKKFIEVRIIQDLECNEDCCSIRNCCPRWRQPMDTMRFSTTPPGRSHAQHLSFI